MSWSSAPSAPRFEHRTDAGLALGLGTGTPRLSWSLETAAPSWRQAGYEVEVTTAEAARVHRVRSGEQVLVPWPGRALRSRESAAVRVRVTDGEDWSPWGETGTVEAGLLDPSDWTGRFISPTKIGGLDQPAPTVRGVLLVPGPVRRARLYATAHGVYLAHINGRRVDDTVLAPGWTCYQRRLRYHAYDVTGLIREGANELDVLLGNGWYRGYVGYFGDRALYGDRLALLAQLEVETVDGTTFVLATDNSWTAREGEITGDDLYHGQVTDLRRRAADLPISPVEELATDTGVLVAAGGPPIRPTGVLPAERVWTSPAGRTLVDFGQNAVGWVRIRVRGLERGHTVVVSHAEVLENDELGTRPLRAARATDSYILAGKPEETLEPALTLHGFRYADVSGIPGLRAEDIEAVVVGSDLRRTGWFDSSDPLLNRLHENVVWSTRGNFVDVPTDCPQRDERLGWTGDIQVFAPTASFLFDSCGFLRSWLEDLAAEQHPDGSVPHVVPNFHIGGEPDPAAAAWGDAATMVPWTLYERTGDVQVLDRQMPSMRAWVDKVAEAAGPDRLWNSGFQFGDWLDPTAPPDDPGAAKSDCGLVATAHFARSADVVSRAAAVLGMNDVSSRYADLAGQVRAAFAREYVSPSGRMVSDAQTDYALALQWDLLPTAEQRVTAGNRLADLVRSSGFRIATGFVGTPLVCDALAATGHLDVAYRLLLQTQCPSWLYPVTMGATTTWERWDSMLPDGSINPGEMTSFNHYALGAVADWLHRAVAGLAPGAPGYRMLEVEPRPWRTLSRARARHMTPYGEAAVAWERDRGRLRLVVRVPAGATAKVHVPGTVTPVVVGHCEQEWDIDDPVPNVTSDWSRATVRDLFDDEATWRLLIEVVRDTGCIPGGEDRIAGILGHCLDEPASRVAHCLQPDLRTPGAAEMRERVAAILAPATVRA